MTCRHWVLMWEISDVTQSSDKYLIKLGIWKILSVTITISIIIFTAQFSHLNRYIIRKTFWLVSFREMIDLISEKAVACFWLSTISVSIYAKRICKRSFDNTRVGASLITMAKILKILQICELFFFLQNFSIQNTIKWEIKSKNKWKNGRSDNPKKQLIKFQTDTFITSSTSYSIFW